MKGAFVHLAGRSYRALTPLIFLSDSEPAHDLVLDVSEFLGKVPGVPPLMRACFRISDPSLRTTVAGIEFDNPIGLAAGFDHEAQMPRIVDGLGFGFQSIGTVTNGAYEGNPYPRIKRLVKSRTMLVYKGFKSTGMSAVLRRIKGQVWRVPVGISIGRTNPLPEYTYPVAYADIVDAFTKARDSEIPFSYFELNISCPNMLKEVSFYEPEHLAPLLRKICALKLPKPLFIKMPIGLSDEGTKALLDTIMQFPVAAVIFGNLQIKRTDPAFDATELSTLAKYPGNWSGMPCQKRSDHLVKLAFNHVKGKLAIVGCGGVFTAEDAYRKIRNGASLVQLVTATVWEGPQVPAEICADLPALLKRDGFKNISEAVGVDAGKE
ncbi:MAG: quinone-dependent dihydroorotate dehydrogenase [Candidatus Paceibacterota bacterium]